MTTDKFDSENETHYHFCHTCGKELVDPHRLSRCRYCGHALQYVGQTGEIDAVEITRRISSLINNWNPPKRRRFWPWGR